MMRFAVFSIRWLCLLAGLCLLQPALALENVTLKLNWTHGFQFAGYYAAQELGYYRAAGLNVILQESEPNSDTVASVVSAKAQFGIGSSSLLLARANGQPVVLLANILQHSPCVLYTTQDIENIRTLIGKKILLDSHSDEQLAYLYKQGIPEQQIQRQPKIISPESLISGQAEAISADLFERPLAFDLAHFPYRTFTPRTDGIDFYGDNLYTSEQELEQHPEQVQAFLQASLRGWRYVREHREEIIDLILNKYSTHHPRDYLQFQAEQTLALLQDDVIDIGYPSTERWQRIADTFADAGLLPRTFFLQGFIYNPAGGKIFVTGKRNDYPWVIAALCAALLLILLFYTLLMQRKLKRNSTELSLLQQRTQDTELVLTLLASETPLTEILRVTNEASVNNPDRARQLSHLASIASEHTRDRLELQKQHDLLEQICSDIPGIIFQYRLYPDGRSCFPFIANGVRTLYGVTPEMLQSDAEIFFAFQHPQDVARFETAIRQSAQSLAHLHIEYRQIFPAHGLRWRQWDATPEKMDDGSIIWHGYISDITARKQAANTPAQ